MYDAVIGEAAFPDGDGSDPGQPGTIVKNFLRIAAGRRQHGQREKSGINDLADLLQELIRRQSRCRGVTGRFGRQLCERDFQLTQIGTAEHEKEKAEVGFGDTSFAGDERAFDNPEESPFGSRQGQDRQIADAAAAGEQQSIEGAADEIPAVDQPGPEILEDRIGGEDRRRGWRKIPLRKDGRVLRVTWEVPMRYKLQVTSFKFTDAGTELAGRDFLILGERCRRGFRKGTENRAGGRGVRF